MPAGPRVGDRQRAARDRQSRWCTAAWCSQTRRPALPTASVRADRSSSVSTLDLPVQLPCRGASGARGRARAPGRGDRRARARRCPARRAPARPGAADDDRSQRVDRALQPAVPPPRRRRLPHLGHRDARREPTGRACCGPGAPGELRAPARIPAAAWTGDWWVGQRPPTPTSPTTSPALAALGRSASRRWRRSAARRSVSSGARSPPPPASPAPGTWSRRRSPTHAALRRPRCRRSSIRVAARSCWCATSATWRARCSRTRTRRGRADSGPRQDASIEDMIRWLSDNGASGLVDYMERRGAARTWCATRTSSTEPRRDAHAGCSSTSARRAARDTLAAMLAALAAERDAAPSHATTDSAGSRWVAGATSSTRGQQELAEHLFRPHLDALGYEYWVQRREIRSTERMRSRPVDLRAVAPAPAEHAGRARLSRADRRVVAALAVEAVASRCRRRAGRARAGRCSGRCRSRRRGGRCPCRRTGGRRPPPPRITSLPPRPRITSLPLEPADHVLFGVPIRRSSSSVPRIVQRDPRRAHAAAAACSGAKPGGAPVTRAGARVGEGPAGLGQEAPLVAGRVKRQREHAERVVLAHLAVRLELAPAGEEHAARARPRTRGCRAPDRARRSGPAARSARSRARRRSARRRRRPRAARPRRPASAASCRGSRS